MLISKLGHRFVMALVKTLVIALLVLPWIHAYTAGPIPNAWPWMIAMACALVCLLLVWTTADKLDPSSTPHLLSAPPDSSQFIAMAWLLAAMISSAIGLVQYFDAASGFTDWLSQTENPGEAFGNLRQRNQYASLTSIGLAAALGWVGLQQGRISFWLAAGVVLLALGSAASNSRTGLLQWLLLPALAWMWVWASRSRKFAESRHSPVALRLAWLATAALLAYGLAVLLLPRVLGWVMGVDAGGLWGRLGEQAGCSSRWILWANVLALIAEKPWFGWGWGQLDYAHFIHLYEGPRFCEILDNAHNLPLHLAVELGVPAALLLCAGALWAVLRCKPWAETDPVRQMAWSMLAVIALHSLVEYPLWYGPFQLAVGLAVLLLWQNRSKTAENSYFQASNVPKTQQTPGRAAIILIAAKASILVALGVLTYGGWEYQRISQIYLPPAQRSEAMREHTLEKIGHSWLFEDTLAFAELSITPLSLQNAAHIHTLAVSLLAYSPEAMVVEKIIESAAMLGRENDALFYLQRYRAAYPEAYARWSASLKDASR